MMVRIAGLTAWRDRSRGLPALPVVGVVIAVVVVVLVLWSWQKGSTGSGAHAVVHIALILFGLFAAACTLSAGLRADKPVRRGWLVMSAGVVAWSVGISALEFGDDWPTISSSLSSVAANLALLLFPVCAGCAVVLVTSRLVTQSRIRLILEAIIVATSLAVLTWAAIVENHVNLAEPSPVGELALLRIGAEFLALAIAALVWIGTWPSRRLSVDLLAAGVVMMAVSDVAQAYVEGLDTHHGHLLIEAGRLTALGLIGVGALANGHEPPVEAPPFQIPTRIQLWLPYIPLPPAIAVLILRVVPNIGPALAITCCLLLFAVFSRQFVMLIENHRLLSAVGQLAFRDQLTGLANRARFLERLEQAVARQRREAIPLAVLCLDLDNFKTINDELGHPAGDELLVRVAGRLAACLRGTDTVARLGGDEFAVLIEASIEDSVEAANRILDSFDSPIVVDGVSLDVRPSIGLTVATGRLPTTVDDLVRHADLAMYAAKRSGGACVRSFVPELPNPYEPASRADDAKASVERRPAPAKVDPTRGRRGQPDAEGLQWPPRFVRFAFAAALLGEMFFAVSTLVREPGRVAFWDSWLETALLLSAAALVAVRAWRTRAERPAWLLISAGMAATCAATVVYAYVPEGQVPSAADPVFLAFYPLVFTGLLLLIRGRLRQVPAVVRLDSLVVALAVSSAAAGVAMGPLAPEVSGSPARVLVTLAYPAGGLVLLAITVGSLTILGWRPERRWTVLFAGFAVWVVVDVVYLFQAAQGTYREGTIIDAGWPAAFLLLAAASWLPSAQTSPRSRLTPGSLVLPLTSSAVALAVLVLAYENRLAVALAAASLATIATRFAVTFRDMLALAEGHQQAMTDELTGLANRRALVTTLIATRRDDIAHTTPHRPRKIALLLLDLDQFGEIRGSLGDAFADDLMRRIAHRLRQSVRAEDLLARTGYDEFAVLLTDVPDSTAARAHAGELREALRAPFALDHITIGVDASITIALWPDHCARPQDLLGRAEAVVGHARTLAGRIAVYDASADPDIGHDATLVDDLHAALAEGQLTCHYQPKISAQPEQVHSVEALVRWHHPTRGLLLPDEFLPLAEEAGMMRPVTTRVLDIALGQVRAWRDKGITLTVAVNLSTTNLLDLGLVETIDGLLRTHGLSADALILELTEKVLTANSYRARDMVAALRRLGIRFALDDYGTGWSSLARLQDLSVDELKLDQVFVARLSRDSRSIAIVRSTVALAHSLGAELVAEGVEDETTLHALREYGCTITQGHVHSPPLPADQLEAWLRARSDPAVKHTKLTGV